jgi:hypothetical protein
MGSGYMSIKQPFDRARKGIELYEDEMESWKIDHEEAMTCLDLEEAISLGIYAFKLVLKADQSHRRASFEGKMKFNEAWEKKTFELFRDWVKNTEAFVKTLELFEQKGFDVGRSNELRSLLSQAKDILTPDDDFFQGPKLDDLKKKAIKANRSGQTEDLL